MTFDLTFAQQVGVMARRLHALADEIAALSDPTQTSVSDRPHTAAAGDILTKLASFTASQTATLIDTAADADADLTSL